MRFDTPEQQQFFAELLAQAQYPGHLVPFAADQMRAVEEAEIAAEVDVT